ncbi:MAG: hypothetical protein GYB49_05980 [Alphaproteobacteria bacterium]|nr:hypothetical protein [Alphaproteobacteria bacterium]|tara:strand:+ start:895 stop:2403 length:1509 start_codon:yes stop_codon:yes gene_type:complete
MRKLIWVFAALCLLAGEAFGDVITLDDCKTGKPDGVAAADFQVVCTTLQAAQNHDAGLIKATAEAEKVKAEAESAKIAAQTASKYSDAEKLKALTPEFDPDKSGGVDVKEGGGKIEGELLALAALKGVAQEICNKTSEQVSQASGNIYIRTAGEADPSRADILFTFQLEYLKTLYNQGLEQENTLNIAIAKFEDDLDATISVLQKKTPDPLEGLIDDSGRVDLTKNNKAGLVPDVLAFQAVGNAVAGFTQLFATEFAVGGVKVSEYDQALVSEVVGCLDNSSKFSAGSFNGSIVKVDEIALIDDLNKRKADLSNLENQKKNFESRITKLDEVLAVLAERVDEEKEPAPSGPVDTVKELKISLAEIKDMANEYAGTVASYRKSYDELIKALATVDGPLAMSELLRSRAFAAKQFKHTLELKIDSAGGSFYTKKNVWSSLGDMPFEVAGGATVHFVLYDSAGAIKASGAMGAHSGYYEVDDIPLSKTKIEPKLVVGPEETKSGS